MTTAEERYQANLELIRGQNSGLAENLNNMPITGVRLLPSPNTEGRIVGQIYDLANAQWLPLCDPNDPEGEALKDVEGREPGQGLYLPDKKCFVLLGLGNGYFAVELAKKLKPWQKLAVFDTNPNCYKASMYCVDMAPLLGNSRCDTFIGDNLDPAMQQWWLSFNSHEKFHIAPPMRAGYTNAIDKDAYDSMLNRCMDMMRYHAVGLATWRQFGGEIGRNDFGNLPEFLANPGLEKLKGQWAGKPAFCLAAGPSLRKNLHTLMEAGIRDKVAIISVGTIYALLRALQFEPDLVTTIDFQRLNWTDQFQHIPLNDTTPLLYLHSTHPETPRRWPGPRFVAMNSSDTVEWMRKFTEEKMSAAQVQTVAHLSLVAAVILGANPIVLMGQDLAMPFGEHHTPGARAQDTTPGENEDAHVPAEDIYGEPCWSRHSFLSMRTVFSQIVMSNPGPEYINCTEGGIEIQNIPNAPLATVIANIKKSISPSEISLASKLKKVRDDYKPDANWDLIDQEFDGLVKDVKLLSETAESVHNLARNRRKELKRGDNQKVNSLAKRIVAKEKAFQEKQVAFSLFAVRRFDIVELLSRIPPPDGTTLEELNAINADKITQVSKSILDESANIQRDLQNCLKRLNDVRFRQPDAQCTLKDILRMMARQSYTVAAQLLKEKGILPVDNSTAAMPVDEYLVENIRVQAHAYKQLQQYDYAAALLDAFGLSPETVTDIKKKVGEFHNQHREVLPKYYSGELNNGGHQVSGADAGDNGTNTN